MLAALQFPYSLSCAETRLKTLNFLLILFYPNNPRSHQDDISVTEGRARIQETLCHERCPTLQPGLEEENKTLPIITCTDLTVESILSVQQGRPYEINTYF